MNRKKSLSLIIPVYNEADNIESLVLRIHQTLKKESYSYEIIFIDDHSTDNTREKIQKTQTSYPVFLYSKRGKKGKAFSIHEGISYASGDYLVMIDADLQYPPESIPEMVQKLQAADIIVAARKTYKASFIRRAMNKTFKSIFGKILFGLDSDVQSGLKVFKRLVVDSVKFTPKSAWSFDLEFLHKAREAGFKISDHDIPFDSRKNGESKVNFITSSLEIGLNALLLKFSQIHPQHIALHNGKSMLNAGVGYKKKQYVTHTTLPHQKMAIRTLTLKQHIIVFLLFATILIGFVENPLLTLQVVIGALSFIYFLDVLFALYIILKSLHLPQEIVIREKQVDALQEKRLPIYSILCPLYKEAHVIPQFLSSISKLDWPKEKLDVLLLLEEDDKETILEVKKMILPSYVRTIIVPDSFPKTKPKACNYGLAYAKGEYVVVFDAEDVPDPLQLKKAYLAFQKVGREVLCLQAKLNYYNPHQNLLTRFFTAEYSLWFDITLTGYQSINTTIPLGGTSNHFRKSDLLALRGWDPFNVTEDADLGIRLFKEGYKTAIIDSTTLEEANSKWGNWMRQRSRWIKGYMQTYLVHTREIFAFNQKNKWHVLIFHLVIGGKIAFILINPFLWLATLSYFVLYAYVGPTIEALYPSLVFYMAVISLVMGNFLFIYYYMIGCIKREQWSLVKYTLLVPFYWIMISIAGFIAFYQLLFKPHYWEKTVHGLHLQQAKKQQRQISIKPAFAQIRYFINLFF